MNAAEGSQHGLEGTEDPSPNTSAHGTAEGGSVEDGSGDSGDSTELDGTDETRNPEVPGEAREDVAERPGHTAVDPEHADEVADEWGEESFPASDPPSHY